MVSEANETKNQQPPMLGRMLAGLEMTGTGILAVDYVADTVVPDEVAARIFALTPHQTISRDEFHARIHSDDIDEVLSLVDRLRDPAFEDTIDFTHRTVEIHGEIRSVRAKKRLYRATGEPLTAIATVTDISIGTRAREAEQMLIQELTHRNKNIISVVSALAQLNMRSGTPETFLQRFLPRLVNLGRNQDMWTPSGALTMRGTAEAALAPFTSAYTDQILMSGPDVHVNAAATQAIAVALHELATNAAKYGALSVENGLVALDWEWAPETGLVLSWKELNGPPVQPQTRTGFGTKVLTRFCALSLSASTALDYNPSGLSYIMRAPASAVLP